MTPRCRAAAPAAACAFLLAAGCRTPEPRVAEEAWPSPLREAYGATAADGTNRCGVAAAVAAALASSPDVARRATAWRMAAGDAAEPRVLESPELRGGFGHGREAARGGSWQTETGGAREREAGSVRATQEELGFVESDTLRAEQSERRSQFRERTRVLEQSAQDEDGFSLELRLSVPSPWALAAEARVDRARTMLAAAELREAEHEVACDVVEAAVRAAYAERVHAVERELATAWVGLAEQMGSAFAEGLVAYPDRVDAAARRAEAAADAARSGRRADDRREELAALTGLEAGRLDVGGAHAGAVCPPVPDGAAGWEAAAASLATQRADVLAAAWTAVRCRGEWQAARARRIPWPGRLEVAYSWWDEEGWGRETGEKRATQSTRTDGTATRTDALSSEVETRTTSSAEYETSWSRTAEDATRRADGREWWVGAGVEIPVFEWCSGETALRREAWREADRAHDALRARAGRDIAAAARALARLRAEDEAARRREAADVAELERLAALCRGQGLRGAADALRLEERIADIAAGRLEREQSLALAELRLCRAAGVAPGRPPP